MRKRAHISVLTTIDSIWVSLTKFSLVFLRMVKVFNPIVAHVAFFAVLALSCLLELRTQFRDVVYRGSSPISLLPFMVVEAFF